MTGISQATASTGGRGADEPTSMLAEGSLVANAPPTIQTTADSAIAAPIAPAERPLLESTSGATSPETPVTTPEQRGHERRAPECPLAAARRQRRRAGGRPGAYGATERSHASTSVSGTHSAAMTKNGTR